MIWSRLQFLNDDLRTNFWVLPLFLTLLLGLLAPVVDQFDRVLFGVDGLQEVADPNIIESATTLMITIAGAVATIAGTIFSLMLVVLTLASQQYGPIIVVNFIRDRQPQIVFGLYLGTFTFCLLTLIQRSFSGEARYSPVLSIVFASAMAILCVISMIFFIHHIAISIRPTSIVGNITRVLNREIERIYPEATPDAPPTVSVSSEDEALIETVRREGKPVLSTQSGYVNLVLQNEVMQLAQSRNVTLLMFVDAGSYVVKRAYVAAVFPAENWRQEDTQALNDLIEVQPHRTPSHDVEFSYMQLVAIAVKALSPAVNDPFTAMMCIDRLAEAYAKMRSRRDPNPYLYDERGVLRAKMRFRSSEDYLHLIFDQIWHYGIKDLKVVMHVLEAICLIGEILHDPAEQAIILRYTGQLWGEARNVHTSETDRAALNILYHRASTRLVD